MRWNAEAALMAAGATAGRGDTEALRERCEAQARAWGMASVQPATVVRVAQEVEKERSAMGMATAGRRIEVRRTRGGAKRRVAVTVAGMALALLTATGVAAARPEPAPVGTVAGVYRATACWSLGAKARACVVGESEDDGEAVDIATEMVPDGYYAAGVPVVVTVAWIAG
jgi:hypothetical protein